MLEYLEFTVVNNEQNALIDIEEYTIIICENYKIKKELSNKMDQFFSYKNKEDCKFINFDTTNDEENIEIKMFMNFLPTTVFKSNEQTIVVTVEASAILSAKNLKDIWFCSEAASDKIINVCEFFLYSADAFIGSSELWNSGESVEIYKAFVNGQYGTYTGEYLI